MPALFGYICSPNASVGQVGDDLVQREAIETFAIDRKLSLQAIFTDPAETSHLAWFERPAGKQLAKQLERGSVVVVSDLATICVKLADLLGIIESFNERGIVLTIIKFKAKGGVNGPISTVGEIGETLVRVLSMMVAWSKNDRSEAVSKGMREKKQRGRKYCRHAGYGYRWRHSKRKTHPEEQPVIAKIVKWREKGLSWYEIAADLLKSGVVAATGREWSPSRVRRVYYSELQRRAIGE